MKEVCLVWEMGGEYDSRYETVILIFETLEEGEAAVKAIEAEMKKAWKIPEPTDILRSLSADERSGFNFNEARAEYDEKIREVCQVYPSVFTHTDGQKVVRVPDKTEDPSFWAVMVPISKLSDLTKTG